MNQTRANLLVTLDTECDKGPGWRLQRPLRFKNILDGVAGRLQPLLDEHGLKPTYLLSPEVLEDDSSVAYFRGLGDRVELGTHLHAEFVEPCAEPDTDCTVAFQSDFPPDVEFEKPRNLTRRFAERIGRAPTSFRAGRYGISPHTLGFLEDLGYRVDSSVTPHTWWRRGRHRGVNFLGAPDQPYHPCATDFRKPGGMRILEVPITLVNRFWDQWPRALRRSINPLSRWQTVPLSLFKRRFRSAWLRPSFTRPEEMLGASEYLAGRAGQGDLTLCMMFHSNEASAGTSPYNLTEADVDRFFGRLRTYLDGLRARFDVRPLALSDVEAIA